MYVIITGTRSLEEKDRNWLIIQRAIDLSGFDVEHIICGGSDGIEHEATQWAKLNKVSCTVFPANWVKHGIDAFYERNKKILDFVVDLWNWGICDEYGLIAIPGLKPKITWDMIDRAKKEQSKSKEFKIFVYRELVGGENEHI